MRSRPDGEPVRRASQDGHVEGDVLREAILRNEAIANTAAEGIWLVDANARTSYINGRMAEILGAPSWSALELSVLDFVFPEDEEHARERISRNLHGISEQFDFRFRRCDGTPVLVLACTSPVRNDAGEVVGALGMFTDITARKLAEVRTRELLESERKLRDAAERAVARTSHLQGLTAALAGALTPEQVMTVIIDQGVSALGAFGGAIGLRTADGQAVAIQRSRGYAQSLIDEFRVQPLDAATGLSTVVRTGAPIWVETPSEMAQRLPFSAALAPRTGTAALAVVPLRVREHNFGALLLAFAEPRTFSSEDRELLTALSQQCAQAIDRAWLFDAERQARDDAEQALQRITSLQELTAALAKARSRRAVAMVVLEQAVPLFGAAAGTIGAYDARRNTLNLLWSVGYDESFLALRQDYPVSSDTLGGLVVSRREALFIESVAEAEDLSAVLKARFQAASFVAAAATPLMFEDECLGFLVFNYRHRQTFLPDERTLLSAFASQCAQAIARIDLDAAEQEARAQAAQALRQRETFLAAAAHELKTPLTSLRGFAQLLDRRLNRGDALTSAELRSALQVITRQSVRLNALVDQMLDVGQLELGQLSLRLELVDLSRLVTEGVASAQAHTVRERIVLQCPERLWLRADPARMEQVLANLLNNALKYSPVDRPIEVELSQRSTEAVLCVRDHGPGIPATLMEQLFRPYAQHDLDDRLNGLGLGLHVSREIVRRHGGQLTAETPRDGGALLTVRIPLQ